MKLKNDKCPEYIIEMIKFKLDKQNNREEEIKESWSKISDELSKNNHFQSSYYLTNKLNKIISKLNDKNEVIKYFSCLEMSKVDRDLADMLNKVISKLNKKEPIKKYYDSRDEEYK